MPCGTVGLSEEGEIGTGTKKRRRKKREEREEREKRQEDRTR